MGLLSDIYVSTEAEAANYDTSPERFKDRVQRTSLTPLEVSTLWALMRGTKWTASVLKEFPRLLIVDGGERVIHGIPAEMSAQLAHLSTTQITDLAIKWAATDEWSCGPELVRPIIADLVRLATTALQSGQGVYLWNRA